LFGEWQGVEVRPYRHGRPWRTPPDISDDTSPAHRTDIGDARALQLTPQKRRGFELFVREFGTSVYLATRRDDDVDDIVRNPLRRHRVRTFRFPLAP
jgi:hypothetical protein